MYLHENRTFYAIYDSKSKLYWDQGCSSAMSWFKHDKEHNPKFIPKAPQSRYSIPEIVKLWRIYEFQRTQYRPDWPKTTIRKLVPRVVIDDAGSVPTRLDPLWVMFQKVRARHGNVIADALENTKMDVTPTYAIKRKGKTGALVKEVLPDSIWHNGMYMFFTNNEDIILAKIALGANIAYEYDLTVYAS